MTQIINTFKVIWNSTLLHYRAKREGVDVVGVRRVDNMLVGIKGTATYLPDYKQA